LCLYIVNVPRTYSFQSGSYTFCSGHTLFRMNILRNFAKHSSYDKGALTPVTLASVSTLPLIIFLYFFLMFS
jgi:hypothetical protein